MQAVEALKVVTIVSLNGHSQTQLPCTLALNVIKRLTTHCRPALHLVQNILLSTLTSFTTGTKTDEQCAGCIAFHIIICSVSHWREEQLAARVLPHIAVIMRCNGTHALFSDAIVHEQLTAIVSHTHLKLWLVGKIGSPAVVVYRNELNLSLVHNTANLSRLDRSS